MKKPDSSLPLVLGTRGSALALAQAAMTRIALEEALGLAVEQRIIKTVGDQRQDLKLSEFSTPAPGQEAILDKGIFTKELESALREGEIDAAVHSLKDVPTELEADFEIAGVLPRAAVEDVLLSRCYDGIEELPRGARVATSSVRRRRLLEHLRPDLEVVEIRGNVGTRLRKLVEQEELDGILLARAGLERLGHAGLEDGVLEAQGVRLRARILGCEEFLPAAGQGIVGIEIRVGDERIRAAIAAINHAETFARATAERAFLALLEAGCQTPVGVHSWVVDGRLKMRAIVFGEDSPRSEPRRGEAEGATAEAEAVASQLFAELKSA